MNGAVQRCAGRRAKPKAFSPRDRIDQNQSTVLNINAISPAVISEDNFDLASFPKVYIIYNSIDGQTHRARKLCVLPSHVHPSLPIRDVKNRPV